MAEQERARALPVAEQERARAPLVAEQERARALPVAEPGLVPGLARAAGKGLAPVPG